MIDNKVSGTQFKLVSIILASHMTEVIMYECMHFTLWTSDT